MYTINIILLSKEIEIYIYFFLHLNYVCQEITAALRNSIQNTIIVSQIQFEILEKSNKEYLHPEIVKGGLTDLYYIFKDCNFGRHASMRGFRLYKHQTE